MTRLLKLMVRAILGMVLVTSGALASPTSSPTCPYPGEVSGFVFGPGKQTISWSAAGNASDYDVVRGTIGAFPVGPKGGDEVCFDDIVGTSTTDAAVPAPGQAFWYVVRGESSCVSGIYGSRNDGTPRFTTTCPPKAPPDADTFLYVAGQFQGNGNPPVGDMTFDGITVSKTTEDMSVWLTKVDLATHLSVWATKIVEGQESGATRIAGPFIASDRATGAVYVQIGDLRGVLAGGVIPPLLVYDATSNTVVKATLTRTHHNQHYLIKYDKNGVYQWARTFRFGTTPVANFITEVYRQNVAVLPNGNVVVGVIADVPSGGPFTLSLNDETAGPTNLASVATFQALGQDHGVGALVVLDPAGTFVASTAADVLASGGGSFCAFEPKFAMSRYTSRGIASGMHEHQDTSSSISVALGGGTFTNTHTAAGTEYKGAVAKYDTSLGFAWTADDTEEPSGNLLNSTDLTAVELGDDGSVYSVGAAGPVSPAKATSRSAGWTTPQMTAFQDPAYNVYQSYYNKRSAAGAIEWSRSFLPGSVLDTQVGFSRYIGDIAVVNGVPWIAGYQRVNDLIKFPGLPDMNSANVPDGQVRGWLVKLDPSTGAGESVTKILWNPIFPANPDPWEMYDDHDIGGSLRLIPLDLTRLAVGFRSIIPNGSIILGRGEGNETIFTATAGGETVSAIAVYDEPSGGLYFVKGVPTSFNGTFSRIVGLAGSPF